MKLKDFDWILFLIYFNLIYMHENIICFFFLRKINLQKNLIKKKKKLQVFKMKQIK